jgi:hypothetical protein
MSSPLYLSANGTRVSSADLQIPYYGAAVADLVFPSSLTLTAPVSVIVGNLQLKMGILRQASFAGGATARLVAGPGWSTTLAQADGSPLPPYASPSGVKLSTILRDVSRRVGETVSLAQDRIVGQFFVVEICHASRVLRQLAGSLWWVDYAGVTQVAPRASSVIKTPATTADYRGGMGWLSVATEDVAGWRPGATYSSNTVLSPITVSSTRIHTGNDGTLRMEVLTT